LSQRCHKRWDKRRIPVSTKYSDAGLSFTVQPGWLMLVLTTARGKEGVMRKNPLKVVIWMMCTFALALLVACSAVGLFLALAPDQTLFFGTETVQYSIVRHSDESSWDTVGKNPPIYLTTHPAHCTLIEKSDLVRALTGAWLSTWECSK